jgi:hypothetical protein
MRYLLLFVVVAVLTPSVSLEAQNRPFRRLRVYCFAASNPSGFVDRKLKDRQDSLKDLQEAIAKKKDWLELAESRDDADIVIEVQDRFEVATGQVDTQTTSNVSKDGKRITSNTTSKPLTNYTLRTLMHVGEYEAPINGEVSSEYLFGAWRAAASNVASEVERWAKDNHARITSRTPGRPGARPPELVEAAPVRSSTADGTAARQAVVDWLTAPNVAAAEAFLPASAVSQLRTHRLNARGMQAQTAKLFESVLAFGVMQKELGASASVSGSTITFSDRDRPLALTFEGDAVVGDRAFVTLAVRDGGTAQRGSIELVREGDGWKIAAVDFGRPDLRFPRFDVSDLVSRLAEYVADQLRHDKERAEALPKKGGGK